MTDAEREVLIERRGRACFITLNRPRAINALTHTMVRLIAEALDRWEEDAGVETLVLVGAGDRGLCAGGDVVSLYNDATGGDGLAAAGFWRDEYAMNARIASYPKPIVVIQDGIVLGGGVGVSAHASHRIVTERTRIGFPETTIGFVPDVGATWLLARAPGRLGVRLGLSSESVGAADAILIGFADAFVRSERIQELLTLLESVDAQTAIESVTEPAAAGILDAQRAWTDEAFSESSISGILESLRKVTDADAGALADAIDAKSPIALAVTLEAVQRASSATELEDALVTEFRVSRHALRTHDFVEGIRAQLIDKDRNPHWKPAHHDGVTAAAVQEFFAEPADGDLVLNTHMSKETI